MSFFDMIFHSATGGALKPNLHHTIAHEISLFIEAAMPLFESSPPYVRPISHVNFPPTFSASSSLACVYSAKFKTHLTSPREGLTVQKVPFVSKLSLSVLETSRQI